MKPECTTILFNGVVINKPKSYIKGGLIEGKAFEEANPFLAMPKWLQEKIETMGVHNWLNEGKNTPIEISSKIKEHQERCKNFIEYINMDSDTLVKKMQYSYDVEAQQKAIIAEMKEVLTHIPDNKLAGYPEKLRKLAEKLTKL